MRKYIILLIVALMVLLPSCNGERGANVDPSFNDGFIESSEWPTSIPTQLPITPSTPEPIPTPIEYEKCYTEEELIQVAKFLYQEARGIQSDTRVACVAWIVCNRVDGGYGNTISEIWGYPQIWYDEDWPVTDRMYDIAKDVLDRWSEERATGYCDGRVLPSDYFWYTGDGVENYFRNVYKDKDNVWDYSLPSPYNS